MADNIPLPGAGKVVATEEQLDGSHVEKVSIANLAAALVRMLKDPEYLDRMNLALRVVQQGTFTVGLSAAQTLTTLTTCGTVTSMSQIGAVDARELIFWQNVQMWNAAIRSRVS